MKKILLGLFVLSSISSFANDIILKHVGSRGTCVEGVGGKFDFTQYNPVGESVKMKGVYLSDYLCQIDDEYKPIVYNKVLIQKIESDLYIKEFTLRKNPLDDNLSTFSNEVVPFSQEEKDLIDKYSDNSQLD